MKLSAAPLYPGALESAAFAVSLQVSTVFHAPDATLNNIDAPVVSGPHSESCEHPRHPFGYERLTTGARMKCKGCGEEVDELSVVLVKGKQKKVCEDCKSRVEEQGEIAEAATGKMQEMMEYKGR